MRRRAFLTAAVGAVSATAGCLGFGGGGAERFSAATIRTIDAPGSTEGTMQLPTDHVTVVDVFATDCAPCTTEMQRLIAARSKLPDSVRFVSVTNQVLGGSFTAADLRKWWSSHNGDWTVGIDDNGTVDRELGVSALPTVAVVDSGGHVAWKHQGVAPVDALVKAVRSASG